MKQNAHCPQHSLREFCRSFCRSRCRWPGPRTFGVDRPGPQRTYAAANVQLAPLLRQQQDQALCLDRVIDGLDIDSLAALGFHGPDDIRGLVAAEPVRSAALVTVPLGSTLAVLADEDGGQLTVLAPPELPPNVKKAIEVVSGLVRETPDYQLLILGVLLLWVRKYGGMAWREYCDTLLPPPRELSCLLCYSPGELSALQLPHMVDEASRQHDWARFVHSQWTSSSSGALRLLGLADSADDTMWALAVVRSRAVEFQLGMTAGSESGPKADGSRFEPSGSGSGFWQQGRARRRRPPGPVMTVVAPVVDLVNHSNDPNCVIQLTTDRSRVVLLPRRPVAAGEPLTVDYGFDRSSLELMTDYGFVTSANPYDGDVQLLDADKLPPLELPRLEAAARALLRRWQRGLEQSRRAAGLAAEGDVGGGGVEAVDAELPTMGEDEGDDGVGRSVGEAQSRSRGATSEAEAEGESEAAFSGRLRAAVALLALRSGGGGSSTPATQRIIAGLWHKLVRHCTDSLPTSLEQDTALLMDILAGRVSGFAAGPSMSLDPAALAPPAAAAPPLTPPAAPPAAAPPPPAAAKKAAAKVPAAKVPAAKAAARPLAPGKRLLADAAQLQKRAAAARAAARAEKDQVAAESVAAGSVAAESVAAGTVIASGEARGLSATGGDAGSGAGSGGDAHSAAESSGSSSSTRTEDKIGEPRASATCGSDGAGGWAQGSGGGNPAAAAMAATTEAAPCRVWSRSGDGGDVRDGNGGADRTAGAHGAASGAAAAATGICRSARRAGRLYAAVRARLEYKQVLAVAEELLLLYGNN